MKIAASDWRIWAAAAAAVAATGGIALFRSTRRPSDPEAPERQRRARLNRVGRIAEGQILELREVNAPAPAPRRSLFGKREPASAANGHRRLICYSYAISGVSYETAQDITGLEQRAHLERIVAGQPASIKYDPSNPSNSILLADDWSGLN